MYKLLIDGRLQDELLKKFGEHVKELRLKSRLTQDDVVLNSSKITKATISDIENGKRNFAFTAHLLPKT